MDSLPCYWEYYLNRKEDFNLEKKQLFLSNASNVDESSLSRKQFSVNILPLYWRNHLEHKNEFLGIFLVKKKFNFPIPSKIDDLYHKQSSMTVMEVLPYYRGLDHETKFNGIFFTENKFISPILFNVTSHKQILKTTVKIFPCFGDFNQSKTFLGIMEKKYIFPTLVNKYKAFYLQFVHLSIPKITRSITIPRVDNFETNPWCKRQIETECICSECNFKKMRVFRENLYSIAQKTLLYEIGMLMGSLGNLSTTGGMYDDVRLVLYTFGIDNVSSSSINLLLPVSKKRELVIIIEERIRQFLESLSPVLRIKRETNQIVSKLYHFISLVKEDISTIMEMEEKRRLKKIFEEDNRVRNERKPFETREHIFSNYHFKNREHIFSNYHFKNREHIFSNHPFEKREQFFSNEKPFEKQECAICLNFDCNDKNGKKLDCDHVFHKQCIETWLIEQNTCPICRKVVKNTVSSKYGVSSLYPLGRSRNGHMQIGIIYSEL